MLTNAKTPTSGKRCVCGGGGCWRSPLYIFECFVSNDNSVRHSGIVSILEREDDSQSDSSLSSSIPTLNLDVSIDTICVSLATSKLSSTDDEKYIYDRLGEISAPSCRE